MKSPPSCPLRRCFRAVSGGNPVIAAGVGASSCSVPTRLPPRQDCARALRDNYRVPAGVVCCICKFILLSSCSCTWSRQSIATALRNSTVAAFTSLLSLTTHFSCSVLKTVPECTQGQQRCRSLTCTTLMNEHPTNVTSCPTSLPEGIQVRRRLDSGLALWTCVVTTQGSGGGRFGLISLAQRRVARSNVWVCHAPPPVRSIEPSGKVVRCQPFIFGHELLDEEALHLGAQLQVLVQARIHE